MKVKQRLFFSKTPADSDVAAASGRAKTLLVFEITTVLLVTFGTSGIRSALRLINAALQPVALNQQKVTIHPQQSSVSWLDLSLQLCSAGVLIGWGLLGWYLLARDKLSPPGPTSRDVLRGAGLAALIGLPGLLFYAAAVQLGLSTVVAPTGLARSFYEYPVLVLFSFGNAFAEETVVVAWFITRLRQLKCPTAGAVVAASVLRGSYHLYQGFSAGIGNIIMGLVFGAYYAKTGKLWPLVIAHFLIDAVAFLGYAALKGNLGWLGLG
ncbi:CPBP family intramembrane glutamic endopeptidase [Corynebacterium mendelii]|uniref:CPBP family intramembrane metalloprotease n=1 Tax=Corynebacterium mendelii TaxID=2765362 RepID=A0A939E2K6_9CORY|nr:CPBP family intramembrane glutamic endopeptidase [Corynebacterium mendelii]MBN9645315.1 CPBP family intramembrane metalloprotease [Corynebacterium mendelii]